VKRRLTAGGSGPAAVAHQIERFAAHVDELRNAVA
jgi:hypothetical protein